MMLDLDIDSIRGYVLNTTNMHQPPPVKQSTPKEDFILCKECESYFNILETSFANSVHRGLRDVRRSSDFTSTEISEDCTLQSCNKIHPAITFLLIYSIVWRCHISSHKAFEHFSLNNSWAEELRKELYAFKHLRLKELLETLATVNNTNKQFDFPYIIFSSYTFMDKTKNMLYVDPMNQNPVIIMAGEYVIYFFNKYPEESILKIMANNILLKTKITMVREKLWDEMLNNVVQAFAKIAHFNLNRSGKSYYNRS